MVECQIAGCSYEKADATLKEIQYKSSREEKILSMVLEIAKGDLQEANNTVRLWNQQEILEGYKILMRCRKREEALTIVRDKIEEMDKISREELYNIEISTNERVDGESYIKKLLVEKGLVDDMWLLEIDELITNDNIIEARERIEKFLGDGEEVPVKRIMSLLRKAEEKGEFKKGIDMACKSLEKKPCNIQILLGKGILEELDHRHEDAINTYLKVLDIDPD